MTNVRKPPQSSATPAAAKLDALALFCRSLAGSGQEGIVSDALDLLIAATGYTRGAAFFHEDGVLELAAKRALPDSLRPWIERLSLTEPAWFLAQVAVQARAPVSAASVSMALRPEIGPAAFAAAGWSHAVACPISHGRELYGVMMLASPTVPADRALEATVEIACRLLALTVPRRVLEARSDHAGAAQVAALAVLTCSLTAELDERLTMIEHHLTRQEQLAARLKRLGPAGVGLEIEAEGKPAMAALLQAEDIVVRLLSAFQSAFPVPSDPAASGRVSSPYAPSSPRPAASFERAVRASSPDLTPPPPQAHGAWTEPATPTALASSRGGAPTAPHRPPLDTLPSEVRDPRRS